MKRLLAIIPVLILFLGIMQPGQCSHDGISVVSSETGAGGSVDRTGDVPENVEHESSGESGHREPHEIQISVIVTQILGFLIALWILKKYAWAPLLKSLDERSDRIRKDYEDAEKARKEGERLVDEYEKKLAEIDKLMREKIQQASEEGNALATSIKEEARKEASSILEKARENIEREIASARMGLRNEIVELAIEYAEKVIHYELDEKKHAELVERFLDEMEEELT